jgi:hypothetical protein
LDDGLDETLKDFAVVNLGRDPYEDRYGRPLHLYWYHGDRNFDLEIDEGTEFEHSESLDYLSARYQMWTNKLDPNLTPWVRFRLDDFAGNEQLLLHAVIYSGQEVLEEDWSDRAERVFCINHEEDNFDQIALILVSAKRPPEPGDGPGSGGTRSQPEPDFAKIKVSVETEACRPTMGHGQFTIEMSTHEEDPVGSYSFTERVTGQITFDDFHPGNAEYRGRARVHYEEHHETHVREEKVLGVDWVKDSYSISREPAMSSAPCTTPGARRARPTISNADSSRFMERDTKSPSTP